MAAEERRFQAYPVDVADHESCQECVGKIREEIGPIDILINKMEKVDWDAVMRTNLDSVFNMTKCAMRWSSAAGGASSGMHGFTKSLALEVAKNDVTVNTVSPGFIATKMVMAVPQDILDTKVIPHIPVGRLGQPEEVAALVVYLCSREAAFLTGANTASPVSWFARAQTGPGIIATPRRPLLRLLSR